MALAKNEIDEQIKKYQILKKELEDNIAKNETHVEELDAKMSDAYKLIKQMNLLKQEYMAIIDADLKTVKSIDDDLEVLGLIRLTQAYFG